MNPARNLKARVQRCAAEKTQRKWQVVFKVSSEVACRSGAAVPAMLFERNGSLLCQKFRTNNCAPLCLALLDILGTN